MRTKVKIEVIIPVISIHGIASATGIAVAYEQCDCGNDCPVAEVMDKIYEIYYN